MQNSEILARIDELVGAGAPAAQPGPDAERGGPATLHDAEVHLDRLWDLLRRRDAARRAGQDPDAVAGERPAGEVESYLQ